MSKKRGKKKAVEPAKKVKKGVADCPDCGKPMKKIEAWVCPGCWTVFEMARRAPGED